ncbi:autophagy protein 5 isoform X1 [Rhodamnia argentea]|uniref:Autophagy protein 5 n=1 Tax=Rhodamnia argentea TaxID=178133 RepID=A0A8B8PPN8_9MYRT|nr:autophagy protein 5 isoform X1 [Rhodamnia argentea]
MEAREYVWKGAIPLQIHLHESEVTTLPPPPPLLVLASRVGYLPLLIPHLKPHFGGALPPGADTVWFDYNGLPLKWFIPTGVLFDLLCPEPQRPWNLTVHFRGYPSNVLVPCEGEDSVKWSFINSLKEAAYIITGNCKNVMNMSQSDQSELWQSVMNGDLEAYQQVSLKLKLGVLEDEYTVKKNSISLRSKESNADTDVAGQVKTGRIPVRLYICSATEDFDELEDAPQIDSWDKISYINRAVEVLKEEGKCFTLGDAVKTLLPEIFTDKSVINEDLSKTEVEDDKNAPCVSQEDNQDASGSAEERTEEICAAIKPHFSSNTAELKLLRIHGIEPKLEIPFSWVVNNLMHPEHFLHICVFIKLAQANPR